MLRGFEVSNPGNCIFKTCRELLFFQSWTRVTKNKLTRNRACLDRQNDLLIWQSNRTHLWRLISGKLLFRAGLICDSIDSDEYVES